MKNCQICTKHKMLRDTERNCIIHVCRVYRQFKVMGDMEGPINPDCTTEYDPMSTLCGKSLKDKTLARAGGPWSNEVKKRDNADMLKNKRIFSCRICGKKLKYKSDYCESCAPEEIKKRREYHREIYNKTKGKKDER